MKEKEVIENIPTEAVPEDLPEGVIDLEFARFASENLTMFYNFCYLLLNLHRLHVRSSLHRLRYHNFLLGLLSLMW
jgi:hypothetical protein